MQELAAKSQNTPLSDCETDSLVDILNSIRAPDVIQKLVNHHVSIANQTENGQTNIVLRYAAKRTSRTSS